MDFFTVDVETSNPDLASICQIGIIEYRRGSETGAWNWLVNPCADFAPSHVAIHGISKEKVSQEPEFAAIAPKVWELLSGKVVASHTHFDRASLAMAADRCGLSALNCHWLNTARVVQKAWPQFAKRGYGLANIAAFLQIEFTHHDALEDARAAGRVLLKALEQTSIGIDGWLRDAAAPYIACPSTGRRSRWSPCR